MRKSCNLRLRTVLLLVGVASCLLAFSSIRCALFNISCPTDTLDDIFTFKYDSNNGDVKRLLGQGPDSPSPTTDGYLSYGEALKDRADSNKVIILISTDMGYIHMALNLYYTSFKKLNITNYLFVCSDSAAAGLLASKGIAHFLIKEDRDGKKMSAYGSAAFRRKTHIKTKIIHEALKLSYSVLITDADIVFLKNPFPYFTCKTCDLEIQSDGGEANSGFYFVKPTTAGKQLHSMALDIGIKAPSLSNQKALARALARTKIKSVTLDLELFPHGQKYFESGHRMFAGDNPCEKCVIVHDNWIVSGAAKVYRLKEHLMWLDDSDQYYSNPQNKYMIYDNPIDFGSKETIGLEIGALKSALSIAYLLQRILILPKFHCYGCKYSSCKAKNCSLNTHLRITTFNKAFGNSYRENMFLKNPLVPQSIVSSMSAPILIHSTATMSKLSPSELSDVKHQFNPSDMVKGANSTEILQWFESLSNYRVLHFHSMYKAFSSPDSGHFKKEFIAALGSGLQRCGYRQY